MAHRSSNRVLNRVSYRLASLAALAAAVLLVACGGEETPSAPPDAAPAGSETAAPEKPAAAMPDAAHDAPAPGDADLQVSQGELPAGFPSDLPSYPGSTPGTSIAVPGGGMLVTFESDDGADAIGEFFRRELEGQGWEVTDIAAGDFKATKDGRNARITITEAEGAPTKIAVGTTAQ